MISLSQAFAQWQELAADLPQDDSVMLSESWNNYTDALCKDGELCDLQYHYAPAHDEPMPGEGSRFDPLADDRAFILDAMGVTLRAIQKDTRPGADEWDARASHWRVTIKRGKARYSTWYTMGPAHTSEPDLCDVLNCLLRDAEYAGQTFREWCADLGFSDASIKARNMWRACSRTAAALSRLFTSAELEGLRELFADF